MKQFLLLLALLMILPLGRVWAQTPSDEDDIVIEGDTKNEKPKKPLLPGQTTPATKADEGDDEEKDELEMEADRVTKAKQVTESETPISTETFDADKGTFKRRATYFAIELLGGIRSGIVDFSGMTGLGFDINVVAKMGRNFALAANLNTGALFNSDGDFLQTLAVHLEPRIYIPFSDGEKDPVDLNKGVVEGFVSIKGGYFSQGAVVEDLQKKMTGIGMGIGMGVDWFFSKNLKVSFQFTYYFPYWLEECEDYSGQHHCSSTSVIGHLLSFTSGIALVF
ncbi:hypothetical protein KKF84_06865 [Myxococcota bacterium]|nr:hypothetical protein [Myxococcota bacterium]